MNGNKFLYLSLMGLSIIFMIIPVNAQEMLSNNSFESWTGGQPDSWDLESSVTITQETDPVYEGTYSIGLEATSSSNRGVFQIVPITAGNSYVYDVYLYGISASNDIGIYLNWLDSEGGTISGEGTFYNETTGEYVLVTSGEVTAPAEAASARCRIRCYANSAFGGYADYASFYESGSQPSTPTPTTTPTGPTHTPTTTPTGPTLTPTPEPTSTPAEVVSIYDIQYTADPSGNSPYMDQIVTTEGIVVAAEPSNSYVWIQDGQGAWKGLLVYNPPTDVMVGDFIRVSGLLKEYNNLTEISPTDTCEILATGQPVPNPEVLASGDVAQEQWESVFVRVENVIVTEEPNQYNEWLVDDGSGNIMVNDQYSYTYSPTLNDELIYVQGPLDYSFGDFKIEPRSDDDIAESGVPTNTPTSPPPPTDTPTATPTGPTPTPPPPSNIKINEVHVNPDGADEGCFVEIYNAESVAVDLSSYKLVGINGFNGDEYASISLSGNIPPGGFFVVAQDTSVSNYNMIDVLANFQNGPDNIQLKLGDTVVDAIGYGEFGPTEIFAGEGTPIPYPTPNNDQSLSRIPDGTDTDNNFADFTWGILTPGSGNAEPGEDTPTPPPTSTPTMGPTSTPTSPDQPTSTPTMPDDPTATPTPSECTELGVKIEMPSSVYGPGDDCYLNILICNPFDEEYPNIPVFIILDVYGEYFFGPSFTKDLDYITKTITSGLEEIEILPLFSWPSNTGAADDIKFVSAMTNPQISQLFGELDTFTFGWHE